jgi:hypothetical protein
MKPHVSALALLLATVAACHSTVFPIVPAVNPRAEIRGFEVVRAGTYSLGNMSTKRDASGVLQSAVPDPRFVQRARTVRAKIGVTFGFQFKINGAPDGGLVTLRIVTRYPRPGAMPPGAAHPLRTTEQPLRRKLNHVIEAGYTLQEPWELIPGRWAIEVWSGDRKLGQQEFTLVPESSTGPFRFELYVAEREGAYVGYPLAESGHTAECHDLILSKRMKRRLRGHADSIVEFDGSYVPDAPPGILLERVNGRRWHGRTCRLEAIFVRHIRIRRYAG